VQETNAPTAAVAMVNATPLAANVSASGSGMEMTAQKDNALLTANSRTGNVPRSWANVSVNRAILVQTVVLRNVLEIVTGMGRVTNSQESVLARNHLEGTIAKGNLVRTVAGGMGNAKQGNAFVTLLLLVITAKRRHARSHKMVKNAVAMATAMV